MTAPLYANGSPSIPDFTIRLADRRITVTPPAEALPPGTLVQRSQTARALADQRTRLTREACSSHADHEAGFSSAER